MGDCAVRFDEATKAFQGHVAVGELTLDIPRGGLFGLLGPNGAGKTTALRMATRILRPDSGRVEVLGLPAGQAERDRTGYMPEERGLYPRMVLEEQLLFLAAIRGTPRKEARSRLPRWMERMGLAEWGKRRVNELSKGMQQKAQFIAAVLHEPEILILDEPMSGLDPLGSDLMRDVFIELRRAGKTLILSSHQMETVERLCDSIALIHKGRKLLDGPIAEVKRRYGRNAIALGFEGDGRFVAGLPGVKRTRDEGHFMEILMEEGADPQRILGEVASKLRVSRFEIVEPSLRDIFVSLVGGSEAA